MFSQVILGLNAPKYPCRDENVITAWQLGTHLPEKIKQSIPHNSSYIDVYRTENEEAKKTDGKDFNNVLKQYIQKCMFKEGKPPECT